MNSKGVSEVLGYILILGIVIVAISMVYLKTNSMVENTSKMFISEGIRQSFKRILNVVAISTYGGAPLQSIQVEMQGGTFWISNETKINITVGNLTLERYTGALNYRYEGLEVTLENGAVWERYYGYDRAIEEPRIFIHTSFAKSPSYSTKVVAVVVINRLVGDVSVSGEGSVKLIFNTTSVNVTAEDVGDVMNLTITSPYAKLWYEFFDKLPGDAMLNNTTNTATLSVYVDRIVIAEYTTQVSIET
ncbi:DUF7289 family protein [Geoglobus ahangari]